MEVYTGLENLEKFQAPEEPHIPKADQSQQLPPHCSITKLLYPAFRRGFLDTEPVAWRTSMVGC